MEPLRWPWLLLGLSLHLPNALAQSASSPAQSTPLPAQRNPPSAARPQPAALPKAPGTVHGSVTNSAGTPVVGAHVALSAAGHTEPHETTSDEAGYFEFIRVTPGAFTVEVTINGFDTASVTGTLDPGGSIQIPPMPLKISTVNVSVDAVATVAELSTEQLHVEEQQRLFDLFPNFFLSYKWNAAPLTARQKFTLATKNVIDPGNLLLTGTVAGFQQAANAFPGYGQGARGYGRRYGADLGNLVSGTYMGGAVLPSLFHQDPRYFYKGTGTIRARFFYAVSTAVICRGDNGHRQPAFASTLGDLSAGAISNLYYAPSDRQGAALTFKNGLLAIAGDAMNNVVQELFLRKITHESKSPKP